MLLCSAQLCSATLILYPSSYSYFSYSHIIAYSYSIHSHHIPIPTSHQPIRMKWKQRSVSYFTKHQLFQVPSSSNNNNNRSKWKGISKIVNFPLHNFITINSFFYCWLVVLSISIAPASTSTFYRMVGCPRFGGIGLWIRYTSKGGNTGKNTGLCILTWLDTAKTTKASKLTTKRLS